MVRILLRKVDIVKLVMICLGIGSQVMAEEPGPDKATTDKAYRVELLVYQQPEGQVFGNVQPSKYLKFVNQSADESLLPVEKAYSDHTASSSMQRVMNALHSRNVLHLHRSWIIRLDPSEKITLPLNQTIAVTAGDNDAQDATTQHQSSKALSLSTLLPQPHVEDVSSLVDGIRLNGSLTLARNHYMDMSSLLTFEIVKQGHVFSFDHSDHTRHLKLDKTQYLDNESIGMLIKVTSSEFNPPVQKLEQEPDDTQQDADDEQMSASDAKPGGTDSESGATDTDEELTASSKDDETDATTQADDTEAKSIGEVDEDSPENVAVGSDQSDTEPLSSDSNEISDQSTHRQTSSVADSVDTLHTKTAPDIIQHSTYTDLTTTQDQQVSDLDQADLAETSMQKTETHKESDTGQQPSTSEQNTSSATQDDQPQKKQISLFNAWLGRK